VRAALGLHPQLVAERAGELPLWERHLPETRYVGEVGLDAGPRFYKALDAQSMYSAPSSSDAQKPEAKFSPSTA
jgi:Tat protein secretion system quality control protein TatD with DNase activity